MMASPRVTLAMALALLPYVAQAQHPNSYEYRRYPGFPPGVYEAILDAPVFDDIPDPEPEKGVVIKKGVRISVYSAGDTSDGRSIRWLSLGMFDSEELACNLRVVPSLKPMTGPFVRAKDFRRIASLSPPTREGSNTVVKCGVADDPANTGFNAAALRVLDLKCGMTKADVKKVMSEAGPPKTVPTKNGTKGYVWPSTKRKHGKGTVGSVVALFFAKETEDSPVRRGVVLSTIEEGPDSWGEAESREFVDYSLDCP